MELEALDTRARDRIRKEIASANRTQNDSQKRMAVGRAIEVMAPKLNQDERAHAVKYLLYEFEKRIEGAVPQTIPRALKALLPKLDPDQTQEVIEPVLSAIADLAVPRSDANSAYLLAVMQANETLIETLDGTAVAGFGHALAQEFEKKVDDPFRQAALARAAIPFLKPSNADATGLIPFIAAATLNSTDPVSTSNSLMQAIFSPNGNRDEALAGVEEVVRLLLNEWTIPAYSNSRMNPYRYAAQAGLIERMAPFAEESLVARVTKDLLEVLPNVPDYFAREAFARAIEALAPKMSDNDREKALAVAKSALAETGSIEEATAWAGAVAALLQPAKCGEPAARDEFTSAIVEVLKYPNAAGEPQTEVLLTALDNCWPNQNAILDALSKKRPTEALRKWFDQHLSGSNLAAPPSKPPSLKSENTEFW